MKILIVEDEVNAREGLGNLLGKLSDDYIVCGKASDGEHGVALAKELKPDLIFVDIEMPKLNGLQMIEKIKEDGQESYFVILSGYSDFKYAQKGIKLGVEEYLLKPITYSELKSSMEQISSKFNLREEKVKLLKKGRPKEELLQEVLINKGKNVEMAYKVIEHKIRESENIYIVNLYLKEKYEEKIEIVIKVMCDFLFHSNIKDYYHCIIKEYDYLTVLINTKIIFSEIIKKLRYNLIFALREMEFSDITIGIINLKELGDVKNSLNKLQRFSRWPMVLGNDEIIYEELIEKLKTRRCNYPREIENELLRAIKKKDCTKISEINEKFILYLKSSIYNPANVIETCCNYVFSILSFYKNYNDNIYNEFEDEGINILNGIKNIYTLDELKEQLDKLTNRMYKSGISDSDINSLIVRKTVNYIKTYYSDRTSLEEIAGRMNITPEYLSRLFTKEIGKSFSDYLKEYRINKARELLINNKIKIYEVAEKVGYSDAKYFCKVFKEFTGMTPKEYMKFY